MDHSSIPKKNSKSNFKTPILNISATAQPPTTISLMGTAPHDKPKRWPKAVLGIVLVVVLLLGGLLVSRAVHLSDKIFVGQKTTFLEKIRELFVGGSATKLTGEETGQVNILLLGIGGEGHDGPYLTDTIILAQLRFDSNEAVLTSIPRDYLTDMPDGSGQRKINNAFSDGYLKNHEWNEAGQAAIQTVEKLTGLQIPYFAVVDFAGFEQAVNEVGGLDINIDRTFTDYSFPNDATDGYLPPVTFREGTEHMNGERALIFARSRHAAGPEGSDFARSQRQQKVLQAFKAKVLSLNIVTDIGKLNNLLNIFADHFHTNISPAEIYHVYSLIKERNIQSLLATSLDPDTKLICPEILPDNGAYVLVPCPGETKKDIENFFKNAFAIGKLRAENASVWLATSTGNRAAFRTAYRKLSEAGFSVLELPYSSDDLPKSLLYQVNPKPASVEYVENTLPMTEVTVPPPDVRLPKDKVDLVIILGQDALVEPEPALPATTSATEQNPPPTGSPSTTPNTSGSQIQDMQLNQ